MSLTVTDGDIFIFQGPPLLDQKAMWIIITAKGVSKVPFCDQAPGDDTGRAGDGLHPVVFKVIGVGVGIDLNAVAANTLADIRGNNAVVKACFPKVIILLFCGTIRQIERLDHVALNELVIGFKREEIPVKTADMVTRFDGYIILSLGRESFQDLSAFQDINPALRVFNHHRRAVESKAAQRNTSKAHNQRKAADLPEGGINIFGYFKHRLSCLILGFSFSVWYRAFSQAAKTPSGGSSRAEYRGHC